jgi:hypothetical protein
MLKRSLLAAALSFCFATHMVSGVRAQESTPSPSPTHHVPIALPTEVPPGSDPETYAHFRQRCQDVADLSAANLPMGSGDYGYADACTKEGAFYYPVKRLPRSPVHPTPVLTPGPDGHVPLDIPVNPPQGSIYNRMPREVWARTRAMCQVIADKQAAHQPLDGRLG